MLPQVPGQTFTYRFDKLPCKFEPGITRSLCHGNKMAASLHEQEGITPDQLTTQIRPSSSPASGNSSENSWSLVPKTALPVRMCNQLTSWLSPQKCHVVNLSCMTSAQPAPVIPVFKTGLHFSSAKSIPVSVIKRVQTDRNATCFKATLTNSS